ncbi:MAG: response regulator [Acidimicrobiales bacterium]
MVRPRVLFVDDEPQLLESIKLAVRKQYRVTTAGSGQEALDLFAASDLDKPFDCVVSDMRMPEMTGARLLTTLREKYPDVPRLLLSGQSDFESALQAINDAKIFRFLTKPCSRELLIESIDEALQQARLRETERELLDHTLSGTVSMLTEVLGLVSSSAYSRTVRLRETVNGMSAALNRSVPWDLNLATNLSQLGFVVLPTAENGPTETDGQHVGIAVELLGKIARMETVSSIVSHQLDDRPPVASADPADWSVDALNIEMLRVAVAFDALVVKGLSRIGAADALQAMPAPPPKFLTDTLKTFTPGSEEMVEVEVTVAQLVVGMRLTENIMTTGGPKLVSGDTVLTAVLIGRIKAFAKGNGVVEPISVLVPVASLAKLN